MWGSRRGGKTAQSTLGQTDFLRPVERNARNRRDADSIPLLQWVTGRHLLLVANALLLLCGVLFGYFLYRTVVQLEYFAVRHVDVYGEVQHLNQEALAEAIAGVRGNFITVDLASAKARLEEVPWVRQAALERSFPNRLSVHVEEHRPLARWRAGGLVNSFGELFAGSIETPLPLFDGPKDAVAEIKARYDTLVGPLTEIGLSAVGLVVSPRKAWRVRLNNGLTLELGREKIDERLKTFFTAYPSTIAAFGDNNRTIDLRYSNGFAIKLSKRDEQMLRRPAKQGEKG